MIQLRRTATGIQRLSLLLLFSLLVGCSSAGTPVPADREAASLPAQSSAATTVESRAETTASIAPAEGAIPFDPAVRRGVLANGLTYYVRENHKPEQRAELRLVINAGSLVEDDDQRGLAHFLEHMAFNGTEHFEKQALVDYLEKIGMSFGADVNAYTSFDETVYMLEVPTDDEAILSKAFLILEDWAHGVSFEDEEIEKERGVVIEEWRLGRGAGGRIRDQQLPVLFHDSRYAERTVIGDKTVLESAPPDALRRFYRDWYRPDLMAVVAVGDFDAGDIESRIRGHFSKLEPVAEPRPRTDFPIPDHDETLVSIVTDSEATSINVGVGYKRPKQRDESLEDYRRTLIDSVYDGMMGDRLAELTTKADPPFQFAYAGSGGLGRTKDMYQLFTVVRDGGITRGLETLLVEAKRVEEYGFIESELERAKTQILRGMERAWDERDKRESASYAAEYIRHFLNAEPSPGLEFEKEVLTEMLPGIGLDEINARADQWLTENNRVILVSGPDKPEAGIPDERALLAIFDEVAQVAVLPWVDQTRDEPLVANLPTPGRVVSEELFEALETTRWKLSNGVTVLLKPTDLKNDEVLLRAYSPGGHSLVADADYMSASQATSIVGESGLGTFNQIELGKALNGKVAGAGAYIGELNEGIAGRASPKDLETMFQLVYLQFTGARRDEEAFQSYLSTTRGWLENQQASPGYELSKQFSEAIYKGHPRRSMMTLERLDEVDLDRALAVFRDRFADASDFTFTLVGNFELDSIRPLIETWLGGLPAIDRKETWRDVGGYAERGVVRVDVHKGLEPQSRVQLIFHGDSEWSYERQHLLGSLASALRIRLREVLREDMGGVYGVGVSGSLSREPRQRYNVAISFSCDPGRVDELLEAVFREVEVFRRDGPPEDVLAKVKEAQRRSRETAVQQNQFWLSQLEYHQEIGRDFDDILHYDRLIGLVTKEAIRELAGEVFDEESYALGVLYPEQEKGDG